MLVEDIMKRDVHCVRESDTADTAAKAMRDQNVGFLPVCDDNRKVLGTITDRDICLRVVAEGFSAAECEVGEIMTPEVVGCRAGDDLADAERLMAERRKSRILVLGDDGEPIGVVSLSDIAMRDDVCRAGDLLRGVASREAHI